jgi:hypothetical protein
VVRELAPRGHGLEVLVAAAVEQCDAQPRGPEPAGDTRHHREAILVLERLAAHRQLDEEPRLVQPPLDAVEVRGLRRRELRGVHLAAVGAERATQVEERLGGQGGGTRTANQVAPAPQAHGTDL